MDFEQQQSRLRELIAHGKKQGFVTYAEINDHLLEDIISEAEQEQLQLDEIILMLNDIGIPVYEVPPDMETLLSSSIANNSSEEETSSENTNILSNIAAELGRTTDPVRMYMREMGTVELLTREGEIKRAKRIEEGLQAILTALTQYPENVFDILSDYTRYELQEIRLNDIISGFLDLEELSIPLELPPGKNIVSEVETDEEGFSESKNTDDKDTDDDSDETKTKISTTDDDEGFGELDAGPDPELAHTRFAELKALYEAYITTQKKHGRHDKKTLKQAALLADAFTKFKLIPRQLDKLTRKMRDLLEKIRVQERVIMRLCINEAKMPRQLFISTFPKNETNENFLKKHINAKKSYSQTLKSLHIPVTTAQNKLRELEKTRWHDYW